MRITVNLATRPFVELRPVYLRLRIAMAALILLAVGLGIANHLLGQKAAQAEAQMQEVRSQTAAVESERLSNERRMREPANQAVLDRSRFLNALFQRKSFSWTSVMMDLERVLPSGVQVTSIEPVITPEGDVNIRLRVFGERDRAIELVRNLERSQRFLNPHLANEAAQTEEKGRAVNVAALPPGAVEFDILSGYNPLPEASREKTTSEGLPSGGSHTNTSAGAHHTPNRHRNTPPANPGRVTPPFKKEGGR